LRDNSSVRLAEVAMSTTWIRPLWALGAAAFLSWCAPAAAEITLQILPEQPRYREPVYARIVKSPGLPLACMYGAQARMENNRILVAYQALPEVCSYSYDVELGHLPTGTYQVEAQGILGNASATFTVGAAAVPARYPGNVPAVDYTGLWWNPTESGWGLSIHHGPTDLLIAAWYVYGADREPVWYTLQSGEWRTANTFTTFEGPIYRTTGPWFGGTYLPHAVAVAPVGTGTLSFRDANSGELRFTIDGVRHVEPIARYAVD
jgi:hypothetical protein